MAELRMKLIATAEQNQLLQAADSASRAALEALHRAKPSTIVPLPGARFTEPTTHRRLCERLDPETKDRSAFDQVRFDGISQPTQIAEKWRVWHCKASVNSGFIWIAKTSSMCEADVSPGRIAPRHRYEPVKSSWADVLLQRCPNVLAQ